MSKKQKTNKAVNPPISMKYDERNEKICEILERLANDKKYYNKNHQSEIKILEEVYGGEFRHSYSKLFSKIQDLLLKDIENGESLGNNLTIIKKEVEELSTKGNISKDICDKISKLYDHVNLEIGRFNLFLLLGKKKEVSNTPQNQVSKEDLTNIEKRIASCEKVVDEGKATVVSAKIEIDKIDDKLEKNSMSSITTLTIFSAVILAFTGSITFSSGVFNGINGTSPFRLVFTTALIGIILFNTIFMLLFIVSRLTNKSISSRCPYYEEGEGNNKCGSGKCTKSCHNTSILCMIVNKYAYWLWTNIIVVLLIYYDFILYLYNNPYIIKLDKISWYIFLLLVIIPFILGLCIICFLNINTVLMFRKNVLSCKLWMMKDCFEIENNHNQSKFLMAFGKALSKALLQSYEGNEESKYKIKIAEISSKQKITLGNKVVSKLEKYKLICKSKLEKYKVESELEKYLEDEAKLLLWEGKKLHKYITKIEHKKNKLKFKQYKDKVLESKGDF